MIEDAWLEGGRGWCKDERREFSYPWDRLPACQAARLRLEAYPAVYSHLKFALILNRAT